MEKELQVGKHRIAVLYHYPCVDGAYACYCLQLFFNTISCNSEVQYFPLKSNDYLAAFLQSTLESYQIHSINEIFIIDKGLSKLDIQDLLKFCTDLSRTKNFLGVSIKIIEHHFLTISSLDEAADAIGLNTSVKLADEQILWQKINEKAEVTIQMILSRDNSESAAALSYRYFNDSLIKRMNISFEQIDSCLKPIVDFISDEDTGRILIEKSVLVKSGLCE